jgi:cytochrome b
MNERILVWDLPLRLFHWTLAASFAGAFLTAESERLRDLHLLCGYTFAGAIAFRLVWGLVGTRHARFSALRFPPGALRVQLLSLLRGQSERSVGHGPIAIVMIPVLLGLGVSVAASGLAVYSEAAGEWTEELHEIAAVTMLVVVIGHVLGVVAVSLLQRENLVLPLITGRTRGHPADGIQSSRPVAALLLVAALTAIWWPGLVARMSRPAAGASPIPVASSNEQSGWQAGNAD